MAKSSAYCLDPQLCNHASAMQQSDQVGCCCMPVDNVLPLSYHLVIISHTWKAARPRPVLKQERAVPPAVPCCSCMNHCALLLLYATFRTLVLEPHQDLRRSAAGGMRRPPMCQRLVVSVPRRLLEQGFLSGLLRHLHQAWWQVST